MAHTVVKPEKIAATAAVALEQSLVVPALFQREGIDQYKGAKDDTINVKVEGILPFRTYEWRSGETTGTRASIQYDEYSERTVAVQFGGNVYSAVRLTDEQRDFDLNGWAKLMAKQTEALGRGLEYEAVDNLTDASYAVTLSAAGANAGDSLRPVLIRAREVLNRFNVPQQGRVLVVGTGFESALLNDEKLNLNSSVGESEAVSALREATIGRRFGFDIVVSLAVPANAAYAMHRTAFIFASGAPSVPQSVYGGTASHEGVALRWLQDYDPDTFQDRSVVNTYKGFRSVSDILVGRDDATGQGFVSEYEHFVRAIKLDIDAAADVLPDPAGTPQEAELAAITGVAAAPAGA